MFCFDSFGPSGSQAGWGLQMSGAWELQAWFAGASDSMAESRQEVRGLWCFRIAPAGHMPFISRLLSRGTYRSHRRRGVAYARLLEDPVFLAVSSARTCSLAGKLTSEAGQGNTNL